MSIALLIESVTEQGNEQTVLVPTDTKVLVFSRVSNGLRGRASRWQSLKSLDSLSNEQVNSPVACVITERDVAQAEMGNITNLSIKLMSNQTDKYSETIGHAEMVAQVRDRLLSGDNDLNQFVRDGRRSKPVMLKPILEPAFFPAIVPVEDKPVTEVPATFAKSSTSMPTELAQVPDRKWADTYLNRNVEKGISEFTVYDVALKNKQNVLLRGPAGSGKTMSILAYASERGYRYYNVSANVGLEPSHLFGAWTPSEQAGVFTWQDGPVTDLVRHGGVLLLNEIDFMPERITTVLFGLLDDRREIQLLERGGEVIKAHPDLLIVGDHNPNYRGSRPMNQAWKDRFGHKLEFDYDKAIEKKLIKSPALLEVASKLRQAHDKGEIDTPVSTRGLINFIKNLEDISLEYAVKSYVNGFLDDEREAVQLVFTTAKANIGSDFGITIATATEQSDEVN